MHSEIVTNSEAVTEVSASGFSHQPRRYLLSDGRRLSIPELSRETGIPPHLLRHRLPAYSLDEPLPEEVFQPPRKGKTLTTSDGRAWTVRAIAKRLKTSDGTVRARIESGWSPDEIVFTKVSSPRRSRQPRRS
jgi:hypothetical protein